MGQEISLLDRLKEWYRRTFQSRWVDIGESVPAYNLVEEYEHGAKIHIYDRQLQKDLRSGKKRMKDTFIFGVSAPIEDFDSAGNYTDHRVEIPPHPESEKVVNESKEPSHPTVELTIGDEE